LIGARVAETILASGQQAAPTGPTYGRKRSDQTSQSSCATGAVHIWVPAFAGTTEESVVVSLSPLSSPGSTGRPSIPEAAVFELSGRGVLDHPPSRAMTSERDESPHSRGAWRPSFSINPPSSKQRAQGRPGAGWHPWSACSKKSTRQNHRFSRNHPAFPAQWFYGLYVVSPVRPGFVVTVVGVMRKHHRRLSTCIGAPGPHDFAVRAMSFVRVNHTLRHIASIASRSQRP
jgi:hypothetical protein